MSLTLSPSEIVALAEAGGSPGLLATAPGWSRVRLGDVAAVVNGAAYPSSAFNTERRGMPLIRIRDVGADRTGTWFEGAWEEKHLVRDGDILIGMDGDFRAAHWRGGDALLNQRVCRVDVDPQRYEPRFLLLVLQGYLDAIWAATSSVTVKHLSSRSISDIPLPNPPRDEQRRIVAIVEDHLSRLDAAEAGIRTAARRLGKLREVALASAVAEAKVTEGVTIHRLGDLAKIGSGMTPLRGNKAFYEGGTIPWITSGDLHQGRITEAKNFVTKEALEQTNLKVVPAGSLLIAMYGEGKTRGTAAELSIDATTNQACASVTLHDPTLRSWIRLVLDANYAGLRRLAAGGVQPNLNLTLVKAIEVPVPPASEREEFARRVAEIDDAAAKLEEELGKAAHRGTLLRRSLLTAAFLGRLPGATSEISKVEEMIDA